MLPNNYQYHIRGIYGFRGSSHLNTIFTITAL